MRGRGRGPTELRNALTEPQAPAAGHDAVSICKVGNESRDCGQVADRPVQHVARELLVRRDPLHVGTGEAGEDDVEPVAVMFLGPDRDVDAPQRCPPASRPDPDLVTPPSRPTTRPAL